TPFGASIFSWRRPNTDDACPACLRETVDSARKYGERMKEQQGPGTYLPQRKSIVPTTNSVSTQGAFVQTRRAGTSSQQQRQVDEEMLDEEEENDEDMWLTRMPTSARRYQSLPPEQPVVIRQGNRQYVLHAGPPPKQRASRQSQEQYRQDVEAYEAEEP